MSSFADNALAMDPGLSVLVTMLRLQGIGADPEQLRHRLGHSAVGVPEMLRCAKELGLKARFYKTNWTRIVSTPMPSIAVLRDAGFLASHVPGAGILPILIGISALGTPLSRHRLNEKFGRGAIRSIALWTAVSGMTSTL
jgi:hypothetical protein